MCDAIRIAHPQIASDAKSFFSLAMRNPLARSGVTGKIAENSLRKSCDVGLRCEKPGCCYRLSDAKCLRFGLSLRFGLRCEHPRCQIASDAGRAMRTTKATTLNRNFTLRSTLLRLLVALVLLKPCYKACNFRQSIHWMLQSTTQHFTAGIRPWEARDRQMFVAIF